eukprot:9831430-Prorocentrum_lima.AAC.1
MLRRCESESADQLTRETRHRHILQGRLHHERFQASTLRSEHHGAQAKGQATSRTTDSRARVELERRLIALQLEEQVHVDHLRQSDFAIQFELTSQLKERRQAARCHQEEESGQWRPRTDLFPSKLVGKQA